MKVGKIEIDLINTINEKENSAICCICKKRKFKFIHILSENKKDMSKSKHFNICEKCLKLSMKKFDEVK